MMTTMKPDQFCMKNRKMMTKRGMRTSLEQVRETKYFDFFQHLRARLGSGSLLPLCKSTSRLILRVGKIFFQAQDQGGKSVSPKSHKRDQMSPQIYPKSICDNAIYTGYPKMSKESCRFKAHLVILYFIQSQIKKCKKTNPKRKQFQGGIFSFSILFKATKIILKST